MRVLFPLIIVAVVMIFAAPVYASKGNLQSVHKSTPKLMKLVLGKARIVTLPADVSDILVANPSIIDVQAVQANKLYVVGSSIGDTNVIALDAQGEVIKTIDVHVTYDKRAINGLIRSMFPEENVRVETIQSQVLLKGTASNPLVANKISNMVAHYVGELTGADGTADQLVSNLIKVRGQQQVMLQVRIMEASRTVLKELGVNTSNTSSNGVNFATAAGLAASADPAGIFGTLLKTGIGGLGNINFGLNALEREGLVHILAEPNLTAVSGEEAGFLVGGEVPVPVGRDQIGNLVVEFRQFGVSLNFRPQVMSDKRIGLKIETEVSSLNDENVVVLADTEVKGIDIRRASTSIEIPSGGSMMIGGLLQSRVVKGMSGLPGINGIPIIGDLMKSDSFQREETELLIMVTAYLVEPFKNKQKAQVVPKQKKNQMAQVFAANIRRNYGVQDAAFDTDNRFGYLLD